jgi:hypothetical protein
VKDRASRLTAVIAADLRVRFRRPSTLIIFLLLSGMAYLWVPDPSTGMTLIQVDGKRAIYNSAAIGVGTALLATIFIGLVGFYVVSNAIRRDVTSRCGFVIASTTMRGSEYLAGKFAGNVVFLATFMAGFMVASMAMLLVRGEASLEPLVFIWQYVLLVPPVIMFVSGIALLFESVPLLRGKFGDVAYFFLWALTLGLVASNIEKSSGPGIVGFFDFNGMGFMFDTMRHTLNTTSMSLGHSSFDPQKGLFVFHGLQLRPEWVLPRIVATIMPVLLIFPARVFFHRFDPARVKQGGPKSSRNWLQRIGSLARPLARAAQVLAPRGGHSLIGAARTDALMTITSMPLILLAAVVLALLPLAAMPVAFSAAAILIADISCREKRAGTIGLVFTAPRLKSRFVWWKLISGFLVAALVLSVPCLRLIAQRPAAAPYLFTGILFVVGFSTLLGIVSTNPKTFLVLFLTFWYVVVNDGGKTPSLDFAGFSGVATPAVLASYLTLAILAVVVAEAYHRVDLRRNW